MTTTTTSFLGIPIHGEITRGEKRASQRPLEEFSPILQAVLDDPGIGFLGWYQYTPYFNDGDPCVFGASGFWAEPSDVKTPRLSEDDEEYEDAIEDAFGDRHQDFDYDKRWGERDGYRGKGPYSGPDEARWDRLQALNSAIEDGEFDDVLMEAFGDHAIVMVTREGIRVEEYSHD